MFEKKNFCLIVTGILCLKKKIFVSEFCVCLRILVPEFLSKRILCFGKEFLSYNRNFVFGKRIFVPEFCVCVCLRIFVSEFLVFWK